MAAPQRPELPAAVVATEMQQLRSDMAAARAAVAHHDGQGHPKQQQQQQQQTAALSGDMMGRIDRIEGAMEQLLQKLSEQNAPPLPPSAGGKQ
eukprot:COSAG06_NODE_5565_length_3398_cov_42.002122_6_plen_93_part_00